VEASSSKNVKWFKPMPRVLSRPPWLTDWSYRQQHKGLKCDTWQKCSSI